MSQSNSHTENVYAYNEEFREIYIGDVPVHENGIKKNYYCLGCKRQMQAIKGNIRKQHFKHHVKPNSTERKCTYRDETYRHKLCKDLIQSLKKIKAPAVYKFDPENKLNDALLIKESQFITGHKVLIERYIYESQNGQIEITKKEDKAKNLLIRPDAILLDQNDIPILIIEFVATHKPDITKLIKLRRIGIDAIQLSVPKSSPEEIEMSFFSTKYTKWLFNNEESNTDYVQFSNQYSGAIFEVDQEQRKLFEEGYKCRSAEIGDLIRRIERLLETEQYKGVERNLGSEILRIKENTEREKSELEGLRETYFLSGIEQHSKRRGELESAKIEFQDKYSALETRYLKRKREVEEEERVLDSKITEINAEQERIKLGGNDIGKAIEERKEIIRSIERRREEIVGDQEYMQYKFGEDSEGLREKYRESEREIKRRRSEVKKCIDSIPEEFEREGKYLQNRFRVEGESIEAETVRIEARRGELSEEFREEEARIDEEFERLREGTNRIIENGESEGDGWFAKEYRRLHEFSTAILVYKQAYNFSERVEAAIREKDSNA